MSLTAGLGTTVTPSVTVMYMPLNPMVAPNLIRTVVDTSLHRPDMFELTFLDRDGTVLDLSQLKIGIEVSISVGDGPTATDLITGEVTVDRGRLRQSHASTPWSAATSRRTACRRHVAAGRSSTRRTATSPVRSPRTQG